MIWHLIIHNDSTGRFNMDFDINLAERCDEDNAYFRLYRWKPYCISLGANQSFTDIDPKKAASDNIDIVKRPTGGRAILHAEEVTYSVVMPTSNGLSPKEVYAKISHALIKGLSMYNPALRSLTLEESQPHFPSLLQESSGKLCFASTAKNEIKYERKKVVGSAQRKMNKVLLQHGSILCGTYHRNLTKYINDTEGQLSLGDSTIELETIINQSVDYPQLYSAIISGMEEEWQAEFKLDSSSQTETISARQLQ